MSLRKDEPRQKMSAAAQALAAVPYVLRLYVAGMTPRSAAAIRRVTQFCHEHLAGRFELEIIDLYQKPALAREAQIIAVPTLVRVWPEPSRRFIGDMQDEEKLLFGMDPFGSSGAALAAVTSPP